MYPGWCTLPWVYLLLHHPGYTSAVHRSGTRHPSPHRACTRVPLTRALSELSLTDAGVTVAGVLAGQECLFKAGKPVEARGSPEGSPEYRKVLEDPDRLITLLSLLSPLSILSKRPLPGPLSSGVFSARGEEDSWLFQARGLIPGLFWLRKPGKTPREDGISGKGDKTVQR